MMRVGNENDDLSGYHLSNTIMNTKPGQMEAGGALVIFLSSFFLFYLLLLFRDTKHCHYRCTTLLNRMIGPSNPRCMYVILFFFYQYTYEVL